MTVVLVAYIAVGWASRNRKTPIGKQIYRPLRGMQTTLCLWQNWGMFAPAPVSSSWLSFTGITSDGEEVVLEPLQPESEAFGWRYSRRNKLSMSALNKKRKGLHRGITQYYCKQQAAAGITLKSVRISRTRRNALRPSQALRTNLPAQKSVVSQIGQFKCR